MIITFLFIAIMIHTSRQKTQKIDNENLDNVMKNMEKYLNNINKNTH